MVYQDITRRDQIVAFIESYTAEHGWQSPSLHEIAEALHISRSSVEVHLNKLITEGRALRRDGKFWLIQPALFPTRP